jgi:hypothetical protein
MSILGKAQEGNPRMRVARRALGWEVTSRKPSGALHTRVPNPEFRDKACTPPNGQPMDQRRATRCRSIVGWTIGVTVLVEGITLYLRFARGVAAGEFNATAPLVLQIHHMFWCIPLFLLAPFFWRLPRASGAIVGIGCGFVLSDLVHHCIVLPLTVGNMGWHWP